jgi:hypothetical protein
MSGPLVVLVLLMLLSTTIIGFYWYFRYRRSEMDLRRFEGQHYQRARSRLSGLAARGGQPPLPSGDERPDPGVLLQNLPWSRYTSAHLGYAMSIPDGYVLAEEDHRDIWSWAAVSGFGDAQLSVARGPSKGGRLDQIMGASQAGAFANAQGLELRSVATTTLDGAPARLLSLHKRSDPVFFWYLFSVQEDTLWGLAWSDNPAHEAADRQSFERIRASFRCLAQPGTSCRDS